MTEDRVVLVRNNLVVGSEAGHLLHCRRAGDGVKITIGDATAMLTRTDKEILRDWLSEPLVDY